MDKLTSLVKKAQNIDLEAYEQGKRNYENPVVCYEFIAKKRAKKCAECDSNILEPIKRYQIEDVNPEISKRSCKECGCLLPYLVRQKIKSCKLKRWK